MHGDDDDDFDNTVKGIKEHIQQYEGHSDVKLQTCIGMSQARPFFFFFLHLQLKYWAIHQKLKG